MSPRPWLLSKPPVPPAEEPNRADRALTAAPLTRGAWLPRPSELLQRKLGSAWLGPASALLPDASKSPLPQPRDMLAFMAGDWDPPRSPKQPLLPGSSKKGVGCCSVWSAAASASAAAASASLLEAAAAAAPSAYTPVRLPLLQCLLAGGRPKASECSASGDASSCCCCWVSCCKTCSCSACCCWWRCCNCCPRVVIALAMLCLMPCAPAPGCVEAAAWLLTGPPTAATAAGGGLWKNLAMPKDARFLLPPLAASACWVPLLRAVPRNAPCDMRLLEPPLWPAWSLLSPTLCLPAPTPLPAAAAWLLVKGWSAAAGSAAGRSAANCAARCAGGLLQPA